ncbi:hypothetical protein F7725_001629 [Dissostichus mawsoni]|uniref:Uncharacterized protein n=1 Tax=Dissostichus mawsoni TaxID=36200 RepID=A0A7J5Y0C1_DISMA|nr:hypothetical protein F7725_001629 [Dissostichus mawsoni]
MPRKYKRKTDRVSTPLEELERAVKEVQQGKTIQEPSTSAAAHLPGPSHEPTHVTDPDPGEPPATLTNPEHLSSDQSGSSAHLGYVSPEVILPLPKATERKKKL